ncbi:MAG: hypothetical protein AAFZ07_07975 [Actinomycetota bacterium]
MCLRCSLTALELGEGTDVERLVEDRPPESTSEPAEADRHFIERIVTEADAAAELFYEAWTTHIEMVFGLSGGLVDHRRVGIWAGDGHELIDALEDLIWLGHSEAVVEMAEYAHRCTEAAVRYSDDSNEWRSGVANRIRQVHLAACKDYRPDPVALAGRLLEMELGSELGGFRSAAAEYATVLGETGLAEYRRRLEPQWRALFDAGNDGADPGRAAAVCDAVIGWALAVGDPDASIEINRDDLGPPR